MVSSEIHRLDHSVDAVLKQVNATFQTILSCVEKARQDVLAGKRIWYVFIVLFSITLKFFRCHSDTRRKETSLRQPNEYHSGRKIKNWSRNSGMFSSKIEREKDSWMTKNLLEHPASNRYPENHKKDLRFKQRPWSCVCSMWTPWKLLHRVRLHWRSWSSSP